MILVHFFLSIFDGLESRVLVPQNKNVTFDEVTFCVEPIDIESNVTYYFVMRLEATPSQIEALQRDPWTDGETAYISGNNTIPLTC